MPCHSRERGFQLVFGAANREGRDRLQLARQRKTWATERRSFFANERAAMQTEMWHRRLHCSPKHFHLHAQEKHPSFFCSCAVRHLLFGSFVVLVATLITALLHCPTQTTSKSQPRHRNASILTSTHTRSRVCSRYCSLPHRVTEDASLFWHSIATTR
ncbi:hypothetical protein GQ54DRAFT_368 [Martensiomyces pterosporus]|nr:hypothetical protein GQ54DRAFT_368 [Martensiomyces pterosporus]